MVELLVFVKVGHWDGIMVEMLGKELLEKWV